MNSRLIRWLAAYTLAFLTACAAFKTGAHKTDQSKDKPPPDPPKLVGRIAAVPADKRFVLIQSYDEWRIETGTVLTSRGADERAANLRVTGEKLGQFAAADLQSGVVDVGDAVYSHHVPKPPDSPTVAEPTENEGLPAIEKVQKNN